MSQPTSPGRTKRLLLCSAALSAGAALAPMEARAETPTLPRATEMIAKDGSLMCKVGNIKGPTYDACTPQQIVDKAKQEARAALAAVPGAAKLPPRVRHAACRIGNQKGPQYDAGCVAAMESVYTEKKGR